MPIVELVIISQPEIMYGSPGRPLPPVTPAADVKFSIPPIEVMKIGACDVRGCAFARFGGESTSIEDKTKTISSELLILRLLALWLVLDPRALMRGYLMTGSIKPFGFCESRTRPNRRLMPRNRAGSSNQLLRSEINQI